MRKSGKRRIALCFGLNDFYEHGIARGVIQYAKQADNWRLFGYGWMFDPLEDLEHWRGDGIIARVEFADDADRLSALGIPVVDVAGGFVRAGFSQVNNDDFETGRKAGEYLFSCGFRNLACCGVEEVAWSRERLAGFSEAAGARAQSLSSFEAPLSWWEDLRRSRRLGEWLRRQPRPLGIFACNDTAGVKVSNVCKSLGIAVPEGAAVLGVDNEDILCELSSPTLSSIQLDCRRIGFEAARVLDDILAGKRGSGMPELTARKIEPGKIIERESTRIFVCEDKLVEDAMRYIQSAAVEGIHVRDVVGHVDSSRRTLELRFRRSLGRTVYSAILAVRVGRAKVLLSGTDKTVETVAGECGFHTVQRFYTVFRDFSGMSPGEYREHSRFEG